MDNTYGHIWFFRIISDGDLMTEIQYYKFGIFMCCNSSSLECWNAYLYTIISGFFMNVCKYDLIVG